MALTQFRLLLAQHFASFNKTYYIIPIFFNLTRLALSRFWSLIIKNDVSQPKKDTRWLHLICLDSGILRSIEWRLRFPPKSSDYYKSILLSAYRCYLGIFSMPIIHVRTLTPVFKCTKLSTYCFHCDQSLADLFLISTSSHLCTTCNTASLLPISLTCS